jgi:hypothetical protein
MKSFKKLEHQLIMVLGRRDYKLNTKVKDVENTDTKIYTKGLLDMCTVSIHRGDTSSITISFSENCIQMTYAALVVVTFNMECEIEYIFVDHTQNHKYSAMFEEMKSIVKELKY